MRFPQVIKYVVTYYHKITVWAKAGKMALCLGLIALAISAAPVCAADAPLGGATIRLPMFNTDSGYGERLYQQGLMQFNQGHHDQAAQLWRLLAEDGNRDAQFALGELYASGDVQAGIDRNLAKAAKWYRRAAKQGHASAQYNLGVFYASGVGVPHDLREAARWWRLAALQGHIQAQFNLGLLYAQGTGVEPNPAEAVRWWGMAAEHGYAPAQFNLGLMYIMGEGVKESRTQALRLWQLSAKQGFGQAIHALRVLKPR